MPDWETYLTYGVILTVVVLASAVFVVPGAVSSDSGQALAAANSAGDGTSTSTAASSTSTSVSTASPTPSTPTPTPSTQANLSQVTPVFEIKESGDRIKVALQNTDKLNTEDISNVYVEGITVHDSLNLNDEYPVATGYIDRPATVEVIVVFDDGTRETLVTRHINGTSS